MSPLEFLCRYIGWTELVGRMDYFGNNRIFGFPPEESVLPVEQRMSIGVPRYDKTLDDFREIELHFVKHENAEDVQKYNSYLLQLTSGNVFLARIEDRIRAIIAILESKP